TRFSRDWSSDVCSSDLREGGARPCAAIRAGPPCKDITVLKKISATLVAFVLALGLSLVIAPASAVADEQASPPTSTSPSDSPTRSEARRVGQERRMRWT